MKYPHMNGEQERASVEANRRFYNTVAETYESVDTRRSFRHPWLEQHLRAMRKQAPGGRLLDLGSGSGFIAAVARPLFAQLAEVDISHAMLGKAPVDATSARICAELAALPFPGSTFDAATCFAVLHHLPTHQDVFREVFRVLKPGGVFYTDHDLDLAFSRRFALPLRLYRALCDHSKGYLAHNNSLTKRDYDLTEIHQYGLSSDNIADELINAGFRKVNIRRHWQGMLPRNLGDRIAAVPRGCGPVFSALAIK